jgi:uncharacterized protein (TIGR03435 family)
MIGKIAAVGLVCAGMAMGQIASEPTAAPAATEVIAAPAKSYAFDVVSIRQNLSDVLGDMGVATPDGYRLTNASLGLVINTAYVPQTPGAAFYSPGQVKGLPDWATMEHYDIDARISDADRAAWQNPAEQRTMLRSMLQTMLAARCKLAVHREVEQASIYSLAAGKGGIRFKETDPAVEPPSGQKLPWGGVVVNSMDDKSESMSFYGASMASLASFLSNIVSNLGRQEGTVQDKTGLTGRYDFVIKFPPIERGQGAEANGDPSLLAFTAAQELGLKLEKGKGQVETLVIEHIERPSAN